MSSSTRKTVTIPLPLGSASDYDRMMFPVLRVKGAKEKGDLYLQATLDEIIKIKDMAKNRGGYDHLLQNAKSQYDVLKKTQTKLQQRPATLNPFKLFANQRRARLFHEAGKLLYQSTRVLVCNCCCVTRLFICPTEYIRSNETGTSVV
ncbi:hypothetical protein J3A83DRAFT_4239048 [Scleroderma citrinum]